MTLRSSSEGLAAGAGGITDENSAEHVQVHVHVLDRDDDPFSISSAAASEQAAAPSVNKCRASALLSRMAAALQRFLLRLRSAWPQTQTSATPVAPPALDKPETKQPLLHPNPALLSLVAVAFQEQIQTHVPHGRMSMHLAAPAFDGRTAIDLIARIIKQPDRGLALRVAQALDAQGFFKAVDGAGGSTDEFRDDEVEVYRVRMRTEMWMGPAPGTVGDGELISGVPDPAATGGVIPTDSFASNAAGLDATVDVEKETDVPLPTGVFTLLTDCYSPTCGRISQDQRWPCYSVSCPRRRLNAVV